MKTEDEIQELADKAADIIATGASKYPGMSYEEGIRTALDWVLGNLEEGENPLDE